MKPYCLSRLASRFLLVAMFALTACSSSDGQAQAPARGGQVGTSENSSQIITRNANSGLDLNATVAVNIYRQEAYQDQYPVQVPYQETEEYYENVPYTERVPYTDYEEYYENEYRCDTRYEQECRNEQQCRQVPDRRCRQERVCRPKPREPERCENVQECGTNARGERICKTRRVCHGGGGGGGQDCDYVERCDNSGTRNECRNERVCRSVPRQHCGYQPVRKTRPVTRYRDETRYRQEKRTRTVTKHRTEYRCCVTKYRDVLDRQENYQVLVRFPSNAVLQAHESETLKVILSGGSNGQAISASIETLNTVYGYRIRHQSVQGQSVVIELETAARYTQEEIGPNSVAALRLRILEDGTGIVTFNDSGNKPGILSQYEIVVKDPATGQQLASARGQDTQGKIGAEQRLTVSPRLSLYRDHSFDVIVTRSGGGIGQAVSFVKSGFRPK